ncbi:hypothetical protein K504DRAFT_202679 [Pleomassaria siparia CBS 279.74]|uniref:Uncharacterized protein n=1 Tax=Pleomassaria siparia CBS 279.74 TaxID=1314801 RepID=A0A6G1KIZ4_9PLEO|nr:hypothetical protein K504DRAFT_202679 [Pleomassaria siparia CBS 279.74]
MRRSNGIRRGFCIMVQSHCYIETCYCVNIIIYMPNSWQKGKYPFLISIPSHDSACRGAISIAISLDFTWIPVCRTERERVCVCARRFSLSSHLVSSRRIHPLTHPQRLPSTSGVCVCAHETRPDPDRSRNRALTSSAKQTVMKRRCPGSSPSPVQP